MKTPRRNWTETEVRSALALYLRTEFGRIHSQNPEIIILAKRLDRSVNAVALKMANLAALDESLPRKGMGNASATDRKIWQEFLSNPQIIVEAAGFGQYPITDDNNPYGEGLREGIDRTTISTRREGQAFFRKMILTSYTNRCALTGIDDERLLNASHIIGWAHRKDTRLDPTNGLCLNALHDRAFDRHLISFDDDLKLLVSPRLRSRTRIALMRDAQSALSLPERFAPDPAFLAQHRSTYFEIVG